ncbi:MAG TPA: protein-glutamate O-methyltransferase CheR [Polyangiales bacterium]|nr:protein-glutamate O-methyltransferase CheR [Polyangiales bacterium]
MLLPEDYAYVQQLVLKHAAIMLSSGQEYLVRSRLEPIARQIGLADLTALVERLRKEPYGALHATVVEAMTTNETSFFRDVHPYETLRKHVLPELIARRRIERSLHIWSAACSTGQEPYSLAMLIKDTPELAGWSVRITASDLSRGAMTKAQSGSYTSLELGRGLPARMLAQYFDRDGALFRVKPELRAMIDWRPLNLAEPLPALPIFDVVFLRNVLIYFSPATCASILKNVHGTMSRKGYLLLGTTENMLGLSVGFESSMIGRTMLYRPTGTR